MTHIASNQDELTSAHSLAAAMGVPLPTVSKLLAMLAKAGLLVAVRGAKGGYRLRGAPEQISVAAIITAVDGPIALTQCLDGGLGACELEVVCPSRRGWRVINDAITHSLQRVTLADFGCQGAMAPAHRHAVLEPVAHGHG